MLTLVDNLLLVIYSSNCFLLVLCFKITVGERRVSQLRLAWNDRLRCNGLGGGASGSGMIIFERFARIIRVSSANTFIFQILLIGSQPFFKILIEF